MQPVQHLGAVLLAVIMVIDCITRLLAVDMALQQFDRSHLSRCGLPRRWHRR